MIKLAKRYLYDDKALLDNSPSLKNLYTFSKQGLGLVENISFKNTDIVLYVGEINIPRLKYILDRVEKLLCFSQKKEEKDLLNVYFEKEEKFEFVDNLTNISELRFDKIFIISGLDKEYKSKLREYKSLLNKNASLIIAIDNSYGIKYLLGAKKADFTLSFEEVNKLISSLGLKNTNIYYPFPDYKVPLSLYSDKYTPLDELPQDIAAYNYPNYAMNKPGDVYKDICNNGDFKNFASSFLLVSEDTSNEIFVKYNRNRKEELAIKTLIIEENGNLKVRKAALYESGKEHIKNFASSYEILKKERNTVKYLQASFASDFSYADFEYIKGENLSIHLSKKIIKGKLDRAYFSKILDKIIGEGTVNIDANFDNFILKNNDIIAIDYEWLSKELLEKKYSYYRALKYFYIKYKEKFEESLEDILKDFEISNLDIEKFEKKEEEFQEWVHENNQEIYLDNYFVNFKDGKQIAKMDEELPILREDLEDKTISFDKLFEIKRLTDNHVANLEANIQNLQANIQNLQANIQNLEAVNLNSSLTIAHLNKHLSIVYRIYRKIKTKLNKKFQNEDNQKTLLFYIKLFIKKPIYSIRVLAGKDGIKSIKETYKQRAKLEFSKFENPKVSIIIPAYNQIDYTYACLESILKNTQNISYEVILADDVSTDDTVYIDKFVSNIIVERNETNQGFLRNCNKAAKKARGEYILFLNNDTKVTKDWLDALVRLIDKDKSIGMVGSKLIYPDGRLQEAGGILWSDGSGWNYGRLDDPNKCEYNYVKDVDYISGASIMLRRSLWEQIGGFDERFAPAYCEDSDLAFEIRKRGLRVVYQPKSVVVHFEGVSNGTDVNGTGLKRYQVENSIKLREKWKDEFAKQADSSDIQNAFKARERSQNKKIILFVDHYVPTFDKDAGSKTTYQYLKMLIAKGYIIKFLGDNFLQEEPYTSILEELGIEVLYGNQMRLGIKEWILKNAKDIHLVYLNRPHIANEYIDFIKENTNLKVIYYGHDLHFLREYREYELTKDKEHRVNSKYWKNIEFSVMRKADISYYPSKIETDYINDLDDSIKTKAITAYVYETFHNDINRDFGKREGILFVGGFAHTPNADALFWFIENIWERVVQEQDINFYIVGSNASDKIKALHNPDKGIIFKGFLSDEELEEMYKKTRMVVVPLRYGAGVKGKVIEALYYNMPVLTTSIGAEGIQDAQKVMSIKDEANDFANELLRLYNDISLLQTMSKKADSYIRANNSIEAVWDIVKEDFE